MCELLAVSRRAPVRITDSLREFSRRGGLEGPHGDGWGIAYHDDGDARVIREPECAWDSPWVRLIERQGLRSDTILAHIRQATQGARCLKNTQPFTRELGGRVHVFAHNGDLGDLRPPTRGRFRPIGDTDSERAFCGLLDDLEPLWTEADDVPSLAGRLARVQRFAAMIRALGPSNFVYSDGDVLFVHGDRRRRDGETRFRTPGLYARWTEDGEGSIWVASEPLSGSGWAGLPSGVVHALDRGRMLRAPARSAAA